MVILRVFQSGCRYVRFVLAVWFCAIFAGGMPGLQGQEVVTEYVNDPSIGVDGDAILVFGTEDDDLVRVRDHPTEPNYITVEIFDQDSMLLAGDIFYKPAFQAVILECYGGYDVFSNNSNFKDVVYGNLGDDTFFGGKGPSIFFGEGGSDLIDGGFGNDMIDGGSNNDTISGLWGDDVVGGGDGEDIVDGHHGNDWVLGGPGDDTVSGGTGDDLVFGGEDNDDVDGGANLDVA
jgi:Ca2+-binding RTX toxin-like protein